jgi:hypothetical protein
MPLLEICCPRCHHSGFISADRVPGVLYCSHCEFANMIREGVRAIRAQPLELVEVKPRPSPEPKRQSRSHRQALTPRGGSRC